MGCVIRSSSEDLYLVDDWTGTRSVLQDECSNPEGAKQEWTEGPFGPSRESHFLKWATEQSEEVAQSAANVASCDKVSEWNCAAKSKLSEDEGFVEALEKGWDAEVEEQICEQELDGIPGVGAQGQGEYPVGVVLEDAETAGLAATLEHVAVKTKGRGMIVLFSSFPVARQGWWEVSRLVSCFE